MYEQESSFLMQMGSGNRLSQNSFKIIGALLGLVNVLNG